MLASDFSLETILQHGSTRMFPSFDTGLSFHVKVIRYTYIDEVRRAYQRVSPYEFPWSMVRQYKLQ